jgi:hypothetical protein
MTADALRSGPVNDTEENPWFSSVTCRGDDAWRAMESAR